MPSIAETAYPRLKNQVTDKELQEIYTPSQRELQFAKQQTRRGLTQLGLLVQLKTFQRLGYFVSCQEVPTPIIKHIAQCAQSAVPPSALAQYDKSRNRWRHVKLIRDYLNVKPHGQAARRLIVRSMAAAAQTKHDLADLINVALEELVRAAYELPSFPVLVRAAKRVRAAVTQRFYRQVADQLNEERQANLNALFELTSPQSKTPWHDLKQDPGKPLLKHLAELVWRLQWLSELNVNQFALAGIPDVKIKQFAAEANSLNAARMKLLEPNKRYTLAVALIAVQYARTLDDMGEMTVKDYGKLVDLPTQGKAFVAHVSNWLEEIAEQTDQTFPTNQSVRLENGRPTIRRPKKAAPPNGLAQVEEQIAQHLPPVNLLDILTDTEHWLNWTRFFSPISGHDAKIDAPIARYLATTFCYGCHLGPSQTARSLSNFDHRQVAWVHQRHVREETLDRAIKLVINAYNRFVLFIPCGVWEAVYILDGLLHNTSEIQPDTVHADTQGQSASVFGLAYLLGIKLMPRPIAVSSEAVM